jgi:hypothetical protein
VIPCSSDATAILAPVAAAAAVIEGFVADGGAGEQNSSACELYAAD